MVYFKKHLAEFTVDAPRALYMSLAQDSVGPVQQHKRFIEVIRESVWSRIEFEDDSPPLISCPVVPLAANLLGLEHVESGCQ